MFNISSSIVRAAVGVYICVCEFAKYAGAMVINALVGNRRDLTSASGDFLTLPRPSAAVNGDKRNSRLEVEMFLRLFN